MTKIQQSKIISNTFIEWNLSFSPIIWKLSPEITYFLGIKWQQGKITSTVMKNRDFDCVPNFRPYAEKRFLYNLCESLNVILKTETESSMELYCNNAITRGREK